MPDRHEDFMQRAIDLARASMLAGNGGPFGAVIARDGKIIGEGSNHVLKNHDPTAHGEIMAIRDACSRLNTFSLDGSSIYTTGQPCPMCLGAIHWARVSRIYYGFSIKDAAAIGFDDRFIYDEINVVPSERSIPCLKIDFPKAKDAFRHWTEKTDRINY
jgi:tRNA(Arg) A34 adenosine deaminase TadA